MIHTSAGFVDLQVNGYLGIEFGRPENDLAALRRCCDGVLATGTAAFLPTVITSPLSDYEHVLPRLASLIDEAAYHGRLLGLHLEGPFLSPAPGAIGAHNPQHCQAADPQILDRLQELAGGHIRLLTVAAELPDVDALCRHAVTNNIQVSLGHSLATVADLGRLSAAGARGLTHLGNGLPNQIDRHHNPIWAGLANDDLSAMIITDGHHLPPAVQKVMLRCKGVAKTIVVSDAASIAGLPPGVYETLNNRAILEENGKLHNPDKQCLVGSSAMMIDCMNQLAGLQLLDYEDLIRVARDNPLRFLGLDPQQLASDDLLQFDSESLHFTLL